MTIPYALVQYCLLQFLPGRTDLIVFMLLPFAAILFLISCWLFWRFGVRKYQSGRGLIGRMGFCRRMGSCRKMGFCRKILDKNRNTG